MSRFYDLAGNPQTTIPVKDGSRLRATTITDAKKNGWVASVSTICSIVKDGDFLEQWKINQHLDAAKGLGDDLKTNHSVWKEKVRAKAQEEMSKAPKLGSEVHALVERYQRIRGVAGDLSQLSDCPDNLKPYLAAIHQFSEAHCLKASEVEKRVVVKSARSAGTCDFVGEADGHPVILDWKTQKVRKEPWFYFQFPLQLSAYWSAVSKKARIASVIIDTSGHDEHDVDKGILPGIYIKYYESPLKHLKLFKHLSDIYYALNDWEEK